MASKCSPQAARPEPPHPPPSAGGFVEEALPHLDAIYRFALRLCQGRESDADDLVQETFLRAYRSWHTYRPGSDCRSWLFAICRNQFLRTVGSRGHALEVPASQIDADVEAVAPADAFGASAGADPERDFFDSFVDEEVLRTVDRLPQAFREVVLLSDLEGMSYQEISEVLAIPVGTVKSRLFRGRKALQSALYAYARESGYVLAGRRG